MLVHFRRGFEEAQGAELAVSQLPIWPYLQPSTSYVSVVELGMYEMTAQIHNRLAERGLKTGSPDFEKAFDAEMEEQRQRVLPRLFQEVPPRRYVCFYPMNKHRGEHKNWYGVPFEERARMMRDHGVIGRHYAGMVNQIISGSIGFDDWEWGVDLFADDPVVFKKLVYEMRFDEGRVVRRVRQFHVGLSSPRRAAAVPRGPGPASLSRHSGPKTRPRRRAPRARGPRGRERAEGQSKVAGRRAFHSALFGRRSRRRSRSRRVHSGRDRPATSTTSARIRPSSARRARMPKAAGPAPGNSRRAVLPRAPSSSSSSSPSTRG
jgi:chlorite dismutase